MGKNQNKNQNNSSSDTIKAAHINFIAVIVGALIGASATILMSVVGLIPQFQSNSYNELKSKYDELMDEYETLRLMYDELATEPYFNEIECYEDQVIVDEYTGFSLKINGIFPFTHVVFVTIYSESGEKVEKKLEHGVPVALDDANKFSLVLKEASEDSIYEGVATIVIKENKQ